MGNTLQRRKLRFAHLDEAMAEANQLLAAESLGRLRHCGQWELGQTLGHLATWVELAFTGYPPEVRVPLPTRIVMRAVRGVVLNTGMPTGARIGRVPGGTLGCERIDADVGAERLRKAYRQLQAECPTVANPLFGRLNHAQWIQLNLRHAELHLGFQIPQD